jgi:GH24 family phage-related lysozyme (muramidase)
MSGYVELEHDGKLYITEYHVTEGVLTVYGHTGSEFTALNGMTEERCAQMLLKRLIERGEIDPELD